MRNRTKIFALPYAFGASYIYNGVKNELSDYYDVIPLEYPGHGTRFSEGLIPNIIDLAEDIIVQIKGSLNDDDEYALLGYSMGSLVGFEVCNLVKKRGFRHPETFFAFASPAPSREVEKKEYEKYSIEDIGGVLAEGSATPKLILENESMLEVLKPIVINDLIALRDYSASDLKIMCPVVAVRGEQESMYDIENFYEWEQFSDDKIEYHVIKGGHFFMFENDTNLDSCCEIIRNKMS